MYTVVIVNSFAFLCLIFALLKDSKRTREALAVALRSFLRILPAIFTIVIFIGLLMGFVPRETISQVVGKEAGLMGMPIVASLGAVLHIPSLISFPLAASLLERGASVTSVAVFVTTLTMIGMVTLPLEMKELGRKAASLLRKGARISAIIAFLSAWACIKVPQEIVELQFLGPRYMALRLALTVIFTVLMGLTIERILDQRRFKEP